MKRDKAKVMVYIKQDIPLQKLRMQLSEHPFGTVKWSDGAYYFLCRGREKVDAEIALSFLGYNLRRAIQLVGMQALLTHFPLKRQGNPQFS